MTHPPAHPRHVIKRVFLIVFSLFLLILAGSVVVCAQNTTSAIAVDYFYEEGCLKCQQASPVIENVTNTYECNLTSYEIISSYDLARSYGISVVPAVVVNKEIVITYNDYQGNTALLEDLLIKAIINGSGEINNTSDISKNEVKNATKLSPFLVFIAGLLSGFNPCILAVMAFLATLILSSSGKRKDILKMILGFCTGIFITYMIVGLSIMGTVYVLPSLKTTITTSMIVIIFILGFWHIYDAYHLWKYSKSTFHTPKAMIELLEKTSKSNILLLSFVSGGIFSLVKAPCVGAIYFSILDLLVGRTDLALGAFYLAIYNLGVIFPIIIMGILLGYGMKPETITKLKENKRVEIRLFTGMILLLLALLLHLHII
ncbi:cytochrome c biogenesis protein [uncultured Methanomethylovorans sp.]|uniref:cytochrome c biogenesis protein n=1 Tax=uncultured Methanomethylovorans sp. TaxID=183759 RepID=UPI002AA8EDAE|nr:cytochrome c biogenesis protein [uncultured Methanomethylovorans sp.]